MLSLFVVLIAFSTIAFSESENVLSFQNSFHFVISGNLSSTNAPILFCCSGKSTILFSRYCVAKSPSTNFSLSVPTQTPPAIGTIGAVFITFSQKFFILSPTFQMVQLALIAANKINRMIPIPQKDTIIQENQSQVAQAYVDTCFG